MPPYIFRADDPVKDNWRRLNEWRERLAVHQRGQWSTKALSRLLTDLQANPQPSASANIASAAPAPAKPALAGGWIKRLLSSWTAT